MDNQNFAEDYRLPDIQLEDNLDEIYSLISNETSEATRKKRPINRNDLIAMGERLGIEQEMIALLPRLRRFAYSLTRSWPDVGEGSGLPS